MKEEGRSRFIKWHWKPVLGTHSLVWDETQKIAGKDPDFNRRDLREAIEGGDFPEFELGIQVIEEDQVDDFDFDILDATKLVPEELVPVRRIGKMTLDRNPTSFFSETEQVAFHPGHVVPGIDFSNDPLLHGRLSTPSSSASADRTSTRSRSTARWPRSTTTSATGTCARPCTSGGRTTSRTASAADARCPAPRGSAASRSR